MRKEHPIPWNPALPDLPVSHSLWLDRQSEPSLSNELRCWCLIGELLSESAQISEERQTSPEATPGLPLTLRKKDPLCVELSWSFSAAAGLESVRRGLVK